MGAPVPVVLEEENTLLVFGELPWRNTPHMNFNLDNRKVNLNCNPCDNANDNLAVPSLRESLSENSASYEAEFIFMRLILSIRRACALIHEVVLQW